MNDNEKKERMLAAGYLPHPNGHPRKELSSKGERQHNELVRLRMQVAGARLEKQRASRQFCA